MARWRIVTRLQQLVCGLFEGSVSSFWLCADDLPRREDNFRARRDFAFVPSRPKSRGEKPPYLEAGPHPVGALTPWARLAFHFPYPTNLGLSNSAQICLATGVNNGPSPHGIWRLSVTERPVVLPPL